MNIETFLDLAADPQRARLGLEPLAGSPELEDEETLRVSTALFGASRFLALHAARHPAHLWETAARFRSPLREDEINGAIDAGLEGCGSREDFLARLRVLRNRFIMRIALRDITGEADFATSAGELSTLADCLIRAALDSVRSTLRERYGAPDDDRFAVFGLGKLGASELNFSSDVDLLYVYGPESGETSGVLTPDGTHRGRISAHEYYCRCAEELTSILQTATRDGFVYRVDLRLRPEGDKGDIAVPLTFCELYYESFGREWERAALIRTRPVAGDADVGNEFMEMIRPFVFRKLLDLSTIEELRSMKTRIDSSARANDIKRGPGGIREVEFFVQSFQLIFGGKRPVLQERNTLRAMDRIVEEGLIVEDDRDALADAYVFLRRLEHRIQMVQDLQTHRLPAGKAEQAALARAMGLETAEELTGRLDAYRKSVRTHYQGLLEPQHASENQVPDTTPEQSEAILFDRDLTHADTVDALQRMGFRNIERAYRDIMNLRDTIAVNQTSGAQRRLRKILPVFMSRLLQSADADRALLHLQEFLAAVGNNESYLEILSEETPFSAHLVTIFAETDYLSERLVRNPALVDALRELGVYGRRTTRSLLRDLKGSLEHSVDPLRTIRNFKNLEEVRLGLLYVNAEITRADLHRNLTKTAEAVLQAALDLALRDTAMAKHGPDEFVIIGLGKLGGWEITYGSDLDIVFVTAGDSPGYAPVAEQVIHLLTSYTREGVAYKVDTRLRPTGSNGPLVHSMDACRNYYLKDSALWERQALLRSRPVAGSRRLGAEFFTIAREVIAVAGASDPAREIRPMRKRMERELSKENARQIDLKFGPGGMSELEFTIQCLQLRHARENPRLIVPNTPMALKRLTAFGYLSESDMQLIRDAYAFFRRIETALRLIGQDYLPRKGPETDAVARNLWDIDTTDQLLDRLERHRKDVRRIWNRVSGG